VTQPEASPGAHRSRPSAAQQQVLERIAAQRARLRDRRAQHLLAQADADAARQASVADMPLAQRLAWFTREHPVAVAAVAGAVLMAAGPRKLVRWAGVVLPLILQLRGR